MRHLLIFILLFISVPPTDVVGIGIAYKNDSIKNRLELELDTGKFESEEKVIQFLELTKNLDLSNPLEALFYTKALEAKLQSEGSTMGQVYIHSYSGNLYWSQGIYHEALRHYFAALQQFEKRNDKLAVIRQLNNIGETYKKQKNYNNAAYFLKKALQLTSTSDSIKPGLVLVNLGQLYMLQQKYDSANFYFNAFLNSPVTENKKALAFTYLYKGIIHRDLQQYDSSLYMFNKSLTIWENISFYRGIVETKAELGKLEFLQKHYQNAKKLFLEAEKEAKAINALDLLMKVYRYKINLYKMSGNKDSLINYYELYILMKDSIFNEESKAEINTMSIQYELAQKEKDYYKLALEQNILSNEIKTQNRFLLFLGLIILIALIFIAILWKQKNSLSKTHL